MELSFGLGNRIEKVTIPETNEVEILRANKVNSESDEVKEIVRSLNEPIGAPLLREIINPSDKIAIITSDITRPMPTHKVLPYVIEEIEKSGAVRDNITVVIAVGSHRRQSEEERKHILGDELFGKIKCVDSNPDDVVRFGFTSNGTPVDITRVVAEADKVICLGNIEYHYFAGYSGGAKAIMPGVSTINAIQSNHRMMIEDGAFAGNIDGNPVRMDIEEAGRIVGIDFIVNVVLDEHKNIIRAFAGDYIAAHRAGCEFLDTIYLKRIKKEADIVIVSQGGAPKDLNLYQTQKALDNARHAVRQGGIIILIGSCIEGLGEKTFERWMLEADEPNDLIERIRNDFQLGGHKAAAIALTLKKAKVYLVSDMQSDMVRKTFLEPAATAQEALEKAFDELGRESSIIAMPFGGSTLPKLI